MLAIVKEMGIFVVFAQAVLFFVPKETYAKYVKVLIGIMVIAKLISPMFTLFSNETWEEIVFSGYEMKEEMKSTQEVFQEKDGYDNLMLHYAEIAEEQNGRIQQEAGNE